MKVIGLNLITSDSPGAPTDPSIWPVAIAYARRVLDLARLFGHPIQLLDLGDSLCGCRVCACPLKSICPSDVNGSPSTTYLSGKRSFFKTA
ncbi:unnamed protein product [Protopolystoma xenopodis]|uniref:Uncharacterized protein n=1 Tax=Protopolystoma xenopodis TaxID=117903 RepID=A0A448XDX0_9PLAT|nr:unnamed protein product [Protopolystoma xenopodis]